MPTYSEYFSTSGAFHWLLLENYGSDMLGIGSFDLGVGALGGCISAVYYNSSRQTQIWIIKNVGEKESWTKEYVLSLPNNVSGIRLSCLLKSGELLLSYNHRKLIACDAKTGSVREIKILERGLFFDECLYVRTLVSPVINNGA
ncbi:hypothetical protein IFM89_027143 [Coptis chinensis]|nr:hypothetical protein IFM89_027143 [Coptis chinensis]